MHAFVSAHDRSDWRASRANVLAARQRAIANGDVHTLRAMTIGSALFAIATMETESDIAERRFERVAHGESTRVLHRYANAKAPTIAAVYDVIGSWDISQFDRPDYDIVTDIVASVPGIGPVKASFTVALSGGNAPCVDRHGAREYIRMTTDAADRIIGSEDAIMRTWTVGRRVRESAIEHATRRIDAYRKVADVAFGTADNQWAFFEDADPNFKAHGHARFFEALAVFVNRY
jgi:hypothetical protein